MNMPKFHYSDEYRKARKKAVIFGIIASCLAGPLIVVMLCVFAYNMMCGGESCDGSSAAYCSPTTAPEFYSFVFIWFLVVIILAVFAIVFIADAKKKKIPIFYTQAELANMEQQAVIREQKRQAKLIYIPAYYSHRRGQITFSILAGVCGMNVFYALVIMWEQYDIYSKTYYRYREMWNEDMIFMAVWGAIHLVAAIVFIILANRDMILKNKNAIRKEPQPMVNNPAQYIQNQYTRNPYGQSPYGPVDNVQNPYASNPYQQNAQSSYDQSPYQQNVQSSYDQSPYQQNVQNPYAPNPYQQNAQASYEKSPYEQSVGVQSQNQTQNNPDQDNQNPYGQNW